MTQHFFDFESAALGTTLPAGIVSYLGGAGYVPTIADDSSDRGIRFAYSSGGSATVFAAFSGIGSVTNAADKEIVANCKFVAGSALTTGGPFLQIFQSEADGTGYSVYWNAAGSNWRIVRLNTGGTQTSTLVSITPPFTVTAGTMLRIRFRRTAAGVFRARFAAGATDQAELDVINALLVAASLPTVASIDAAKDIPQAWHGSSTANTTHLSGRFSVGAYGFNDQTFYGMVGIATDGETAPTSSGTPPPGVTVTDAGDEAFTAGETGVVIAGTNFGATQGAGRVWLSPTDNIADAGRVQQTVTAWGDTSVTITVVKGALAFLTNLYLFVETDAANSNAAGHVVQLVPRVYIRETATALSGAAVALNGDALLVWRARPTAANANPSEVLTLGSIPSGAMDVEINRGTLAPGDPVWAMLVSAAGNAASAKRITPVYE